MKIMFVLSAFLNQLLSFVYSIKVSLKAKHVMRGNKTQSKLSLPRTSGIIHLLQ